ncbi:hypothetical protein DIURU_005148 [Diutina rugosa]|uniref:Reverse transcriptase Ty1/copia-type domain-containing protein n=1 Tax=Diutina rugosa TaxID=5481 RepID=A0A642ULD3_DIURU|nr:uncharacterized protein DIURU_005148 [Diutina rugosa]KAA8897549.1 hypothetical protein DIURU_005148 [Diutina rugosa]
MSWKEREQAAIERFQVLSQSESIDPTTAEGRRKLRRAVRLQWRRHDRPNGEQRYLLTAPPLARLESTTDDNSVPVLTREMMRFVLSYAVDHRFEIRHLEIEDAFKYAELDVEAYAYSEAKPAGIIHPVVAENKPVSLAKINKAIMGWAQAVPLWYAYFYKSLEKIGLITTKYAKGVYTHFGEGTIQLIVAVNNDQLLVASRDDSSYTWFVDQLRQATFEVGEYGRPTRFMNIDFTYPSDGVVHLCDRPQVAAFIKKFNIDPSRGPRLEEPIPAQFDWSRFDDKQKLCENMTANQIARGKTWMEVRLNELAEISHSTRHDINEVVAKLFSFSDHPHLLIQRMVQRVMLFVAQTPDHGMDFKPRKRRSKTSRTLTCKSGTFNIAGVVSASVYSAGKMWWKCLLYNETKSEIDNHLDILSEAVTWVLDTAAVLRFFESGNVKASPSSEVSIRLGSNELVSALYHKCYTSPDPSYMDTFNQFCRVIETFHWLVCDIGAP